MKKIDFAKVGRICRKELSLAALLGLIPILGSFLLGKLFGWPDLLDRMSNSLLPAPVLGYYYVLLTAFGFLGGWYAKAKGVKSVLGEVAIEVRNSVQVLFRICAGALLGFLAVVAIEDVAQLSTPIGGKGVHFWVIASIYAAVALATCVALSGFFEKHDNSLESKAAVEQ